MGPIHALHVVELARETGNCTLAARYEDAGVMRARIAVSVSLLITVTCSVRSPASAACAVTFVGAAIVAVTGAPIAPAWNASIA